jgi:hypothetical protein
MLFPIELTQNLYGGGISLQDTVRPTETLGRNVPTVDRIRGGV